MILNLNCWKTQWKTQQSLKTSGISIESLQCPMHMDIFIGTVLAYSLPLKPLACEKTGSWKTWKFKRGKRTVCLVNSGVPTNLISEDDSYMYHNLASYPFVCFPQFITCFIKSNLFAIDAKRNQVNNFVVTLHSELITSK